MIVDVRRRRKLALALRRYASGRIDMARMEEEAEDACHGSDDRVLEEMYGQVVCWLDGLWFSCRGGKRAPRESRRDLARWIIFLHSDDEYRWPPVYTSVWQILLSVATLGIAHVWRQRKSDVGLPTDIWPFISRAEYARALRTPVLLSHPSSDSFHS